MEEKSFVELLLSFVNRKHKSVLWKQRRKLRVTNVFMNVNLTKQVFKYFNKSLMAAYDRFEAKYIIYS